MKASRFFLPCLVILITLSLLACQAALIKDWVTQPGGILYQDEFSDTTSGWERASTNDGSMDYYHDGFRITVIRPQYDLWSLAGVRFRDVRIEVDAGRLAGPLANRYGVVCRYQSPSSFYFFIISSDGYYAVGKVIQGNYSLLSGEMMTFSPAIVTGMGPNHLQVDCTGGQLSFYVNQQPLALLQDGSIADGDIGLIAGSFDEGGVDVIFDNLVVLKP
ncbi:MAG: hypothetical protein ABIJ39_00505 [Chloroflexota bacterium]